MMAIARNAFSDLREGILAWRMWILLGVSDIRQRYKRSKLGQFWITISIFVFILGIGLVYSSLFNQPIVNYLPTLAVKVVMWTFLSTIVSESVHALIDAERFIRHAYFPKSIFMFRVVVRALTILAHNFVIIPIAFILFGKSIHWPILLFIPHLIVTVLAACLVACILSILSVRYRDVPQTVQSSLQIAFFITPVTWDFSALSPGFAKLFVLLNPFTSFLNLLVDPLIGRAPSMLDYMLVLAWISLLGFMAIFLLGRFRNRIIYWM